jgi:archaellum component FlaC
MSIPISRKEISTYVLAGGLFALALAIGYFAFVLLQVKNDLPAIVDGIKEAEDKFQPILDEVTEIRLLIPGIVDEVEQVRLTIPPIVKEVENIRGEIPAILAEVGEIRKQIPEITTNVDAIVAQIPPILKEVEALRTQTIPPVLEEVAALRTQTIPPILDEVAAIRTTTIPPIIDQVESIHDDIPGYFDRADKLVADAKTAGQQASEGAVTGLFTGIIKAPISLVTGVGDRLIKVPEATDEDREIAINTMNEVIEIGTAGTTRSFENSNTDLKGSITLKSSKETRKGLRIIVTLTALKKGKTIVNEDLDLLQAKDGTWEVLKTSPR